MRIKLTVHRHRLPTTNLQWVIPESFLNPGSTIARLLKEIDPIICLESEHWGLEDYIVEIGGFECLHFWSVQSVVKEDDHVV